jgi:hypothetical protein
MTPLYIDAHSDDIYKLIGSIASYLFVCLAKLTNVLIVDEAQKMGTYWIGNRL